MEKQCEDSDMVYLRKPLNFTIRNFEDMHAKKNPFNKTHNNSLNSNGNYITIYNVIIAICKDKDKLLATKPVIFHISQPFHLTTEIGDFDFDLGTYTSYISENTITDTEGPSCSELELLITEENKSLGVLAIKFNLI